MVDPLFIAVLACISGSVLNTVRGYMGNDDSYSAKKLIGAVIVSTFAGIAIAQTIPLEGLGLIGIALLSLTAGFSIDFAVTKAKKTA